MTSRITVPPGPWYQTMPGAVADAGTRARVIEVGVARWMAQNLKRTVVVEADDGHEQLHVILLDLRR